MPGNLTIRQARLVLPERVVTGDLLIEDGLISEIGPSVSRTAGEIIDGTGLVVLPGCIDAHVHFREPGQTHKEDLASGSRAAAAGGVTAFLDHPDTVPTTTTIEALEAKLALAAEKSLVHYGFFIGATADNLDEVVNAERACGISISLSSRLEELLVEDPEAIFASTSQLIAVHAENERRLRERYQLYENSTDPANHRLIRDVETSLSAVTHAVGLAQKYGRRLHIMSLSSAEEADFLASQPSDHISSEVSPLHLFLEAEASYEALGNLAVVNPPVRGKRHGSTLWHRLLDGTIDCIASGHAPHTLNEKARHYPECPSGAPGVEWMLPLLLDQVNQERCSLQQVAHWLSEAPARCFGLQRKGRLETGYDGDVVLVDMAEQRTVHRDGVRSKALWSPYEGRTLMGWPVLTAVLGTPVYRDGVVLPDVRGRELTYVRTPRRPDA